MILLSLVDWQKLLSEKWVRIYTRLLVASKRIQYTIQYSLLKYSTGYSNWVAINGQYSFFDKNNITM